MTIDTTTDREHLPTPEFREYMDWEIGRAFGRDRLRRRVRLAAVIVASLGVGVTAGLAPAQVRQDSARDSLLVASQARLQLAKLRLDILRAQLDKVRQLVAAGALNSAMQSEATLSDMEAEVARIQADMDEIRATGQSPRDELNAPVVNGRDFVSRRVDLQLAAADARLRAAEQKVMEIGRLVRVGVLPEVHELEANAEMIRARKELAVLAEKRALRREFLDKKTPVDQLALRLERAELQQDIELANAQVRLARERLSTLEKLRAAGAIDEVEVMRANLELREREIELKQLGVRIRALPKFGAISRVRPVRMDTLERRTP